MTVDYLNASSVHSIVDYSIVLERRLEMRGLQEYYKFSLSLFVTIRPKVVFSRLLKFN